MIIILCNIYYSISLEILNNSATAIIDGETLDSPFLGGLNYPRNEWVDLDNNNINELMVLDQDGCIRLYEYVIPDNDLESAFFNILDTSYGNLCGMSWFNVQDFDQDNNLELACQSLVSNNQVQIYDIIDDDFSLIGTVIDNNNNPIISDASMVPTFADIDSDGDLDFFTGKQSNT